MKRTSWKGPALILWLMFTPQLFGASFLLDLTALFFNLTGVGLLSARLFLLLVTMFGMGLTAYKFVGGKPEAFGTACLATVGIAFAVIGASTLLQP